MIIFGSILLSLSIFVALCILIVRKGLHNNNLRLARVMVGLLVLQFILGMLSNLFVSIPTFEPWRVFHYFGPIMLHTLDATFLLVFAILFMINTRTTRRERMIGGIGLLGVIIAFASGVIFVNAGQYDIFSFTMSLGFITALIAFCAIAMRQPPHAIKR